MKGEVIFLIIAFYTIQCYLSSQKMMAKVGLGFQNLIAINSLFILFALKRIHE
jgi:hypothetical protein